MGGAPPTLRAAPRRKALPWWVVLIIVVCAIPVLLFLAAAIMVVTDTSLPGSSEPKPVVPTIASDFEAAWTLEPSDADPAATKWESDPDGSDVDERLIAADGTWVAIASSTATRTVAGIDPEAGTVRWSEPLHDALCARELVEGALACLGRPEPTSATELRLYDSASGALRSHAVPGLGLARADGTQPRPVAVAGGALAWTAVDWSAGTQGDVVESFPKSTVKGFDGSALGQVRATAGGSQRYVWQGAKVVAASNDADAVLWTWTLPANAHTDVMGVAVFDDVVVVNERYGLDPKTGRTLWERSGGSMAVAFDGAFVKQATTDEISLLRLP